MCRRGCSCREHCEWVLPACKTHWDRCSPGRYPSNRRCHSPGRRNPDPTLRASSGWATWRFHAPTVCQTQRPALRRTAALSLPAPMSGRTREEPWQPQPTCQIAVTRAWKKSLTLSYSPLARIGFIGLYNPDAVIGEFEVRSGQFELRHVAGDTIAFCDRASLRTRFWAGRFSGGRFCSAVASQALGVEVHRFWTEVVVRVVARQAADARVVRVETLAARDAIRLEANVGDAWARLHGYLRPGTMTLAAKIRGLVSRHPDQPG